MNHASRHLHGLQTVLFLLIFSLVYWSPPASNRVYAVVTMLLCIVGATLSSAGARRVAAAARAGRDDVRS
ncbi:MAG: hypothetical protein CMJ88_03865 [Planctomycetes bacterium]|nr:hypothetical protein [Planctomycetota bacterium]